MSNTETEVTYPCQAASLHARFGAGNATNRVRFYCERCKRGNNPDEQTDMDMCDGCQIYLANAGTTACDPEKGGCGYSGSPADFMHPDGPATGRRPVRDGEEQG